MDKKEADQILAFDTLYTTNQIQIMKILLPFLEDTQQKNMTIFIKYMEFQYTMAFFKQKERDIHSRSKTTPKIDLPTLLERIQPYCSKQQQQSFQQIASFQNTMQMVQEMQGMMEVMKQMQPENENSADGESNDSTNPFAPGNNDGLSTMLKSMLSEEQQAMFDMFSSEALF